MTSLSKRLPKFFVFILIVLTASCKKNYEEPTISLEGYEIEEGFELSVIASEPFLEAPVQIDFDSKGRIWVAEMNGFMRDVDGTGENRPTGTIKILEDLDQDGVVDHSKIFIDSLVMPRALAMAYGGLLYVEPPNLYFVDIDENDQPINRVLVDSLYALEGNPEYQPNGLRLNIDNWFYNAGSHFKYQRKNGEWIKKPTTYRGQWGVSQDNFGRLYYNNNSTQLLGDYILPNRLVRNEYMIPNKGVNQKLTKDQNVYPIHAARVNRGYVDGVLNKDSLLLEVTAACSPLVYRGSAFPANYDQNVFVCIPEINAIKRNILSFEGNKVVAKQAWNNKEFLASTDEGFRPVNLSVGPDGNMYVVDMHRGVIQHNAFLSPYLKKKAKEFKLDTIVTSGRILKITSKSSKVREIPNLDEASDSELVALLSHENGYIRDQAQHRLVYKGSNDVVPLLKDLANDTQRPIAQIHALNTLNGLGEGLSFEILSEITRKSQPDVVAHAIVLLENFREKSNIDQAHQLFEGLSKKADKTIDLYLASTLGYWSKGQQNQFLPLFNTLQNRYKNNPVVQEALMSGMENLEPQFLASIEDNESNEVFEELWEKNQMRQAKDEKNPIYVRNGSSQDSRTKGAKLYRQICAACHQADGTGAEGLAPPLANSEHIFPSEKLGLIILHGLRGPIDVNGVHYDINHAMPGLNSNETLSDKDISAIVSYVSNAFSKYPKGLREKKVKELRDVTPKEDGGFTIEELDETLKTLK
ncbi:MAG: dehydrogenase [Pseudozobellia sp.]|nr:dehydrogenase [Pseudozobellia sp.]MBG50503.1 dehydrogenase [Pseudozobellia sp.]|tara:strand:+ start:1316 stop:3574 length:2259 start_codon:yes stop_codon:yes gene_type:complete